MKSTFTKKEQQILQENPYTLKVTKYIIQYTPDFKTKFWEQYRLGVWPSTIFKELGYDVAILGAKRIEGAAAAIKKQAEIDGDFVEISTKHRKKDSTVVDYSELPPDKAIRRMQTEIEYLRQEMEFLKKIMQAENTPKRRK